MIIPDKNGFYSKEDRKEPLIHNCDFFSFRTHIDLSGGVFVVPLDLEDNRFNLFNEEAKAELATALAKDVAVFIAWWMLNIYPHLNGFSGIDTIEWIVS